MTPLKLRLNNFIGIKSGLGRDAIVLDLEKITEGAQLIALIGPNGAGKSTILDNLTPFLIMASRAGSYSTASFSFYENIYGTEASKVLDWEHDGHRYRSELIFKMGGKTKKTEAYLFEVNGDELKPVIMPDGERSDGKVESYNRCVEAILGTPEMFFTSVFASQGRKSLSSYTNGEIKTLLAELLGLDHIREQGDRARDVAKGLRLRLDGMRDELAGIVRLEDERAATETELDATKDRLAYALPMLHQLRGQMAALHKRLADIEADRGSSLEVEARRNALTAEINGVNARISAVTREIEVDKAAERTRAASLEERLTVDIRQLSGQIAAKDSLISQNWALLDRKAEIAVAVIEADGLAEAERQADANIEAERANVEDYRALVTRRTELRNKLDAARVEGKNRVTHCDGLKLRAGLVTQVPCAGTTMQSQCPLLRDAIAASTGIPAVESSVDAARDEYARIQADGIEVDKQIGATGDPETGLRVAEAAKRTLAAQRTACIGISALAPSLAHAEQTIAGLQAQIKENEDAAVRKQDEINSVKAALAGRLIELERRLTDALAALDTDMQRLQAELAGLPPPLDDGALEAARKAVADGDAAVAAKQEELDALAASKAALDERLRGTENRLRTAGQTRAKASLLETEVAHWTALSKALSNDGIIALSIDDAGPTIAGLANDLLMSCYGPRFSLSLRTQEETQKGDMRETFDIRVFDAERDDDKSVGDMSGGERIWIETCLTRAIALFNTQTSGRKYGTLFSDESDGALDPERKQMFMAMKRRVLEIGEYEQEFFISHTPELWDMADKIIDVKTL
jgi:DNA repair protein SbcC/Rad50